MISALVEAPPLPSSASAEADPRRKRRMPPLSVEEERVLLGKVRDARLLRGLQKTLAATEEGGVVTVTTWARQAGLEVEELRRTLQEGLDAKSTLVERNMPMVMTVVEQQYRWRLRGGQISAADLMQEGAYALGVAAERFDPDMPNRFLTYALFIVRDKLDTAVAGGNMAISVPVAALKELHRTRRELTAELGRAPSEAELANFFANGVILEQSPSAARRAAVEGRALLRAGADAKEAKIETGSDATGGTAAVQPRIRRRRLELLAAVQRVTSLDTLIRDSDGNTISLVDTIAGQHGDPLRMPGNGDISELIPKVLTRRQAELVRMACGLADGRPVSMVECSRRLTLSVGKTKALFENSLEKLRIAATADNPRLYH